MRSYAVLVVQDGIALGCGPSASGAGRIRPHLVVLASSPVRLPPCSVHPTASTLFHLPRWRIVGAAWFIVDSSSAAIVVQMMEGKDTPAPEIRKKSRRRGVAHRPWTLREYAGKTVWDWMQLLIVPLVIVGIGAAFTLRPSAPPYGELGVRGHQATHLGCGRLVHEQWHDRAGVPEPQAAAGMLPGFLLFAVLLHSPPDGGFGVFWPRQMSEAGGKLPGAAPDNEELAQSEVAAQVRVPIEAFV